MAITIGTMIMVKGIASSPMPNTAPPSAKSAKSTGISKASVPLVLLIIFNIPASTAPVLSTMPKAPPTTNINAIMPTEVPHLSPFTRPSKAKFKKPISPKGAKSLIPFFSPVPIYLPYSCSTLKLNSPFSFFSSKDLALFFLMEPKGSSLPASNMRVLSPDASNV
ncbi:hypothetical protein SDC9_162859 [bioreactor metagenome]|uniref:Uncharacterized protein n=1 Tax=bioreactor metagenome TaxID=1076179 RepID=A0A645FM86_9ZZZZ